MNTDLISINQSTAVEVLSSPDQVTKIIEEVKVKINTLDGGTLDTGVGRKKIITNANKAKKSKTAVCKYIDDLILIKKVEIRDKTLDENETIRLLLESKETLSNGLDEVYKETRQAVTEFEAKLKADKAEATAKAEVIRLDALREADHEIGLLLNEKYDNEKAAAAEKAEAERVAKEEEIKRQAAEVATAKAEKDAADKIAQAERDAAKAKQDAIDAQARVDEAAEREKKQAEQAEINRLAQIEADKQRAEQSHLDKIEADKKAKINAEIAAENARLAQVKRQQDIDAQAAAEQAKRDANKSHTAKVRRTAKDLLVARHGLSEEVAKAIIIDLHKRVFADITINY